MNYIQIQYFKISPGELILGSYGDKLCICDWRYRKNRKLIDERIRKALDASFLEEESAVISRAKKQLAEYMEGRRKEFDIPLLTAGSDFQKSVWNELLNIPFGETKTYTDLSRALSNQKAIRAVAAANGANAISIIIPCHRILGSRGELVGYAGGLKAKKQLLQLEGSDPTGVQMELFE